MFSNPTARQPYAIDFRPQIPGNSSPANSNNLGEANNKPSKQNSRTQQPGFIPRLPSHARKAALQLR